MMPIKPITQHPTTYQEVMVEKKAAWITTSPNLIYMPLQNK